VIKLDFNTSHKLGDYFVLCQNEEPISNVTLLLWTSFGWEIHYEVLEKGAIIIAKFNGQHVVLRPYCKREDLLDLIKYSYDFFIKEFGSEVKLCLADDLIEEFGDHLVKVSYFQK
jgi:hypothetical protein